MRKNALSRAAERAAAARAKLAASKPAAKVDAGDKDVIMSPPKATEETPALVREVSDVRPSTPGFIRPPVINTPLHPSLPPKPGSPTKPQLQEPVRPTTPAAIPVPPPPVVVTPPEAAPAPAPLPVPAVDDQIAKLEEVRVPSAFRHISGCLPLSLSRISSGGLGSVYGWPVISICSTLARSG